METSHPGFWEGIAQNLAGAGHLRLIVQPVIAIILGVRLGIADAHEGKAPFGLRLLHTHRGRGEVAKQALSDVIVPFCVAIVVDSILQHYTLGYIRPIAALIVGVLLVFLPFALARGFTNRIVRRSRHADATT